MAEARTAMRTIPSPGALPSTSSKRIVSGPPSSRTTQAFTRGRLHQARRSKTRAASSRQRRWFGSHARPVVRAQSPQRYGPQQERAGDCRLFSNARPGQADAGGQHVAGGEVNRSHQSPAGNNQRDRPPIAAANTLDEEHPNRQQQEQQVSGSNDRKHKRRRGHHSGRLQRPSIAI